MKLEKITTNIKKNLTLLFKEFTRQVLLNEITLEMNQLPSGVSREKFKKQLSKDKSMIKRGVIDRLFLEHVGILPTIKDQKSPKIRMNNIQKLKELNEKEKELLDQLLRDI